MYGGRDRFAAAKFKKRNTQMPQANQNSFQRGVMTLLVLALLDREDMYGYQLVQEISTASSGKIVTQEGSLYPVLYKLQDQKLISDNKKLVGKRKTRIYYHLEDAGKAQLQTLLQEYDTITQGVLQVIQRGEHHG